MSRCCCCYRTIDQLNRERKLQQQAAGSELRSLEDRYYNALRKNLEIDAACQSIEEEIGLLEARIATAEKRQQQQQKEQEQEQRQREQEASLNQSAAVNGAPTAAAAVEVNGVMENGTDGEGPQEQQQQQPEVEQQQQISPEQQQ